MPQRSGERMRPQDETDALRDGRKQAFESARSMIEASLDSLVSISPEGKITDVNEATTKVTGAARQELIGAEFSDYFTEPDKAEEIYQKVFAEGMAVDYPLTIRHRDGTLTDVLYNASVYRDAEGNVLGVFAAARDVTEQKQAQADLKVANADLQTTLEAMRNFVAIAAHELRTPLTSIVGFATLLNENWATLSDEDRRTFVATIDRQSQHLARLIDDLLTLSLVEASVHDARPERLVLGEAIGRCLEAIGGETASVSVSCPADLVVKVNPPHLQRILDNLMQNALKYGEPPVRIEATRVDDMVEVRVLDHGPGVPPEFLPRLFGRFARADTSRTRAEKGTGLGLTIVRGLAEANGGQARYEPNAPNGACFVVLLLAADGPGE